MMPSIQNDDHCSACLGRGRLLCCDSCPRAFHFQCLEEGFETITDVEVDTWDCRSCRARKIQAASSRKGKRKAASPATPGQAASGLFDRLLVNLESLNPRVFELPGEIVNAFENVYMHPATGAYIDTREIEITRPKSHKAGARKGSSAAVLEGIDVAKLTTDPSAVTCHQCGNSGYKLRPTALLASYSIPQPENSAGRPQALRTDLVKCDYCPLHWHLDCLTPPLTCIPPELKEEEKEVVDAGMWHALRLRTWGADDRGERTDANGEAETGVVHLRRKWMCPCHADWSMPKQRVFARRPWVEINAEKPVDKETNPIPSEPILFVSQKSVGPTTTSKMDAASKDLRIDATQSKRRPIDSVEGGTPTSASKKARTSAGDVHGRKEVVLPKPKSPTVSEPLPPPIQTTESANNGNIEVVNDSDTTTYYSAKSSASRKPSLKKSPMEELEIGGVKYKLPERRIKLDFLDRVRTLAELRALEKAETGGSSSSDGKDAEKDQRVPSQFSHVGATFRSCVNELYEAGERGVDTGCGPLPYAASAFVDGAALRHAGSVRATDKEAIEWLESVTKMQSELAYLLQMRMAANAYIQSGLPGTAGPSTNATSNDERPASVPQPGGQQKDPAPDVPPAVKVAAVSKTDTPPIVAVPDDIEIADTDSTIPPRITKTAAPQQTEPSESKDDVVVLDKRDPEWLAFCAWKARQNTTVAATSSPQHVHQNEESAETQFGVTLPIHGA
ncbi:uncharacterized protein EV422DRAFT_417976 [Fimicolochytrium jonesii]|uniref:uncharacterized protein n=1 Tax=Fimicolochytrium jonesii TaxID=1396493 RepID=UPI0022FF17DB|nr:uncharacterized protein EV422DRAFT_417976 [Fimicolochytrium jonesii]KAI8822126.1 hypothetical protein EV422DRAFT_417976 [Fimicolochytrium jonesii]